MMQFQTNDGSGAHIGFEVIEDVLPQDTMFIHGNMASNRWWYPAADVWRKKASGQRLPGAMILAELRGCGKSSAPRDQADVDMHLFAQDFIGLAKSLKRGKIHLVGHSTGGLIVALMLAKAPELFEKAVLLDPVGAKGVTFNDAMTDAFEQMKTNRGLVSIVIGSTIRGYDTQSEFFDQVIVADAFLAAQTVGDKVLRALDGLDSRNEVSKVKHAVLVLHGEHDLLLPIVDSQEMASLMSNARFEVVPEQGHCTNLENPEKFVLIADKFLFSGSGA
ncbi:MAG: alpha/beta fold hydrolase [Bdellovibrio sp.]|jgi:3-oxoadipate enol-lactonase